MYNAFYGLREKPFTLSPDPRFLFLAGAHREALAHLLYGIEQGEGFIAITGEVGTGKTTLCRALLDRLGSESDVAFLFNPSQTAMELLRAICSELGIETSGAGRGVLLGRLNSFLLDRKRRGKRVLLIIDEAQNLGTETLEQVRLLSNLETSTEKLIQILLLGQPELDAVLDSPALRQLRQRIGVRWSLSPLNADETCEYVRHRLRVAAGARRELFSPAALREIHRRTGGVPRLVNVLCDRALLAGFADESPLIGAREVRRAAREIPDARSSPMRVRWRRALRRAGAAALFATAAVAGVCYPDLRSWLGTSGGGRVVLPRLPDSAAAAPRREGLRASDATPSVPLDAAAAPAPVILDGETLGMRLAMPATDVTRESALAAVLASFRRDVEGAAPADWLELLARLRAQGLAVHHVPDADLEVLRNLNHPALLHLRSPGGQDRWAALLHLDPATATLYGVDSPGPLRVERAALEQHWPGEAWVVWREFEAVPPVIVPGSSEGAVTWLQESLARLGLYAGAPTGRYDEVTERAVRTLQLARQLEPDGAVGPRTKMVIYDLLDAYAVPRLQSPEESG